MSAFLSLELTTQEIIDVLSRRLGAAKINDAPLVNINPAHAMSENPALQQEIMRQLGEQQKLQRRIVEQVSWQELDEIARTLAAVPEWDTIAPMEAPRSGKWPRLAKIHLSLHPYCAVCETKKLCVPHHIKPFHLHPALELDPDNLITLCPPHHLLFGHLMNWRSVDLQVVEECADWNFRIKNRPMAQISEDLTNLTVAGKAMLADIVKEVEAKCDALFAAHPEIE